MSSCRDKSQGISFVYTNLYTLYKNSKPETQTGVERIDPAAIAHAKAEVSGSRALELIQTPSPALVELRTNIGKLQNLHSKLHVMIKELEELVGVKK